MKASVVVLLLLAACIRSQPDYFPYYSTRDYYFTALDAESRYARWCATQSDQRACSPVVVEETSLAAKAKTMIHHANARRDCGEKSGSPVAELGAKASVSYFYDYVSAHPVP